MVVLLNTVGVIDTSFFKTLPRLGALLLIGLNGGVTGDAAADVLTGRVAPEGKLTATWAENYADYPNADTFGLMDGDTDDERYTEGIYVGYRYFDSFGLTPAYAFGYGLSYTSFVLQTRSVCVENDTLMLRVSVKILVLCMRAVRLCRCMSRAHPESWISRHSGWPGLKRPPCLHRRQSRQ